MSDELKRMADILKSGATMLSEMCPNCKSPLFKIRNEILCVKCNRPVVLVSATEDESSAIAAQALRNLEKTALIKIDEINLALKTEQNSERIEKLRLSLSEWLTIVERVRRLRDQS